MTKLSAARVKANRKWDKNNKERKQYLNRRSVTKNFILKLATKEDLLHIKSLVQKREKELDKNN